MNLTLRSVFVGCLLLLFAIALRADPPASPKPPRRDFLGDPLPEGAIARLGTLRLRQPTTQFSSAISPNGKFIVTSGEMDLTVHVWDAATGKEVRQLRANGDNLATPLAFSPDGTLLAAGYCHDQGSTIIVWDFTTGKVLRLLEGATHGVEALTFADHGKSIVAFVQIGRVYEWDVKTGKGTRRWDAFAGLSKGGRRYQVYDGAAFSRDGSKLSACVALVAINDKDADGEFLGAVWDVAARKLLRRQSSVHLGPIPTNGKRVVEPRDNGALAICDLVTGKEIRQLSLSDDFRSGRAVALSPNGKRMVTVFDHKLAQVWEIATGKRVKQFTLSGWEWLDTGECTVTYFPDNERILLTVANRLSIWNTRTGKEVLRWPGHRQPITHLAFRPDGKRLLSGSGGQWRFPHLLLTWETSTWQEAARDPLRGSDWASLATTSLDHRLAIALHKDGTLHLRDRVTGKDVRKLEATLTPPAQCNCFFSPNGQQAVLESGSPPKAMRLRLVDVKTGRTLCELPAGAAKQRFAFAPDNRRVAWFEADETIRVLHVPTGEILWRLGKSRRAKVIRNYEQLTRALVFSADGRYLASWSPVDNNFHVWAMQTGKLYRLLPAQRPLFRNLEWPAAIAFSPDGKMLAVSSLRGDNAVDVWELVTMQRRRIFQGHVMPVTALAFSADGRRLASGSADTTVLVWNLTGR